MVPKGIRHLTMAESDTYFFFLFLVSVIFVTAVNIITKHVPYSRDNVYSIPTHNG